MKQYKNSTPQYIFLISIGFFLSSIITYLSVVSGLDWKIAKYFEQNQIFIKASFPGVIIGMFMPIFILIYFYFNSNVNIFNRLFYGIITAFLISTLLKSITNRIDMEPLEPLGDIDISSYFRWGFLNSNSLWESLSEGWPSGHTFVAITIFVILFPQLSIKMNIIHFIYILIIMFSVVTAFHWFSDVISGLILGIIIGKIYQIKK